MGFKRAPGWNKTGDSVDGVWKQQLLVYLAQLFDIKILIETGTCEGSTPAAVYKNFEKIYTIELSQHYYDFSVQRLKKELGIAPVTVRPKHRGEIVQIGNIELIYGDSVSRLDELLHRIDETPAIYWLDAHPCNDLSADNGDPLPGELKAIMARRSCPLIVIDDMPDASLPQVAAAGVSLDGFVRDYRTGEVILTKANSGYYIPPFEY